MASVVMASMSAGVAYEQMQGVRLQPAITMLEKSPEECRQKTFVAVYFNGTGLQTSIHSAHTNHEIVAENDGCSIAVEDYGTYYDDDKLATALVATLQEISGDETDLRLLFVGNSLGGIVAQRFVNSKEFQNNPRLHADGFLLQATPGSAECVKGFIEQNYVKYSTSRMSLGRTPILINNVLGVAERRENIFDPITRDDLVANTKSSDSRLIASELAVINQGFPVPAPPKRGDVPTSYWYQTIETDTVQDPECSRRVIGREVRKVGSTLVHLVVEPFTNPGNKQHGTDWWGPDFPHYKTSNEAVFSSMKQRFAKKVMSSRVDSGAMRPV